MTPDIDDHEGGGDLTDAEVIQLRRYLEGAIGAGRAFDTNVELAASAQLSEGTIRKIRRGGAISNRTFNKLAQAFGFLPSKFKAELERLEGDTELKRSLADEIRTAASELPEADQAEILQMIKIKRERQQRNN